MTALDLRALDGVETQAPFDFQQFEGRRAVVRQRHRTARWGAAAALSVLAIVPLVAVLTQAEPDAMVMAPVTTRASAADVFQQAPALVDMERFSVTSELEDHIALLDAEISAARLRPVSSDQLQRMESTRRQLNDSLERVNYAHALLDL